MGMPTAGSFQGAFVDPRGSSGLQVPCKMKSGLCQCHPSAAGRWALGLLRAPLTGLKAAIPWWIYWGWEEAEGGPSLSCPLPTPLRVSGLVPRGAALPLSPVWNLHPALLPSPHTYLGSGCLNSNDLTRCFKWNNVQTNFWGPQLLGRALQAPQGPPLWQRGPVLMDLVAELWR